VILRNLADLDVALSTELGGRSACRRTARFLSSKFQAHTQTVCAPPRLPAMQLSHSSVAEWITPGERARAGVSCACGL